MTLYTGTSSSAWTTGSQRRSPLLAEERLRAWRGRFLLPLSVRVLRGCSRTRGDDVLTHECTACPRCSLHILCPLLMPYRSWGGGRRGTLATTSVVMTPFFTSRARASSSVSVGAASVAAAAVSASKRSPALWYLFHLRPPSSEAKRGIGMAQFELLQKSVESEMLEHEMPIVVCKRC